MSHLPDPTSLLRSVPIVPVVVVEDPELAVPLAGALVQGGLRVIEVTLRTPAALESIARIARNVPLAVVGAGTVTAPGQIGEAIDAGAQFLVSPGTTPRLLDAFAASHLPCLPGVATASEAMAALDAGFRALKFFPAEPMGGVAALKALHGPLAGARFCPTGGIDIARAATYLGLPNVLTVGGSWVAPPDLVRAHAFERIEALARAALALDAARPRPA